MSAIKDISQLWAAIEGDRQSLLVVVGENQIPNVRQKILAQLSSDMSTMVIQWSLKSAAFKSK